MPTIQIEENGCRACNLCVEICPTKVFDSDANEVPRAQRQKDCIGCTSCMYICPSRCLSVQDYEVQRPFHHMDANAALIERFLQRSPAARQLTEADYHEALNDLSHRAVALADSLAETVGRGQKAMGRRSGTLAATHLPEMYEAKDVDEVLKRMHRRFANCFDFDHKFSGGAIQLDFGYCTVGRIVEAAGLKTGEATLCVVFHDYWAGLLGAFTGKNYAIEVTKVGPPCQIAVSERGG